jgi:hypothetical protein
MDNKDCVICNNKITKKILFKWCDALCKPCASNKELFTSKTYAIKDYFLLENDLLNLFKYYGVRPGTKTKHTYYLLSDILEKYEEIKNNATGKLKMKIIKSETKKFN